MKYVEKLDASKFTQGLNIGDQAIFTSTGDRYGPDGWEKVPVVITVSAFAYPFIIDTNSCAWHYSRFVRKHVTQLSIFQQSANGKEHTHNIGSAPRR